MRALEDVWSVSGRRVLAAFDLSPFPLICDVGGERWPHRGSCVSGLACSLLSAGEGRRLGRHSGSGRNHLHASCRLRGSRLLLEPGGPSGSDPVHRGGTETLCLRGHCRCPGHAGVDVGVAQWDTKVFRPRWGAPVTELLESSQLGRLVDLPTLPSRDRQSAVWGCRGLPGAAGFSGLWGS